MISYPLIVNDTSATITIKGRPFIINSNDTRFDKLLDMIRDPEDRSEDVKSLLDPVEALATSVDKSQLSELVVSIHGVTFRGEDLSGTLEDRILWMAQEGLPLDAMEAFLTNLYDNPSNRVHSQLYRFMEYGQLPITQDGHFLAYKRVNRRGNGDLVDVHSGKMVNNVGSIVQMPRHLVDDDPDQTCSHGLHACSHEYLGSFSGNATVTVKINPRDVVAIPRDYNNTKLRCCRYEVVEILDDIDTPVLSEHPVMQSYGKFMDQNNNGIDDREEFVNPDNPELESQTDQLREIVIDSVMSAIGEVADLPHDVGTNIRMCVDLGLDYEDLDTVAALIEGEFSIEFAPTQTVLWNRVEDIVVDCIRMLRQSKHLSNATFELNDVNPKDDSLVVGSSLRWQAHICSESTRQPQHYIYRPVSFATRKDMRDWIRDENHALDLARVGGTAPSEVFTPNEIDIVLQQCPDARWIGWDDLAGTRI